MRHGHIRTLLSAAMLLVSLAVERPRDGEAAQPESERGGALFQGKCVACHTIGQGDRVGPDLAGVVKRRDRAWLSRWIAAPDRVLAAGDPTAKALFQQYKSVPMPNQGLTDDEVAALIAYLAAPGPVGAAVQAPALPPGDAHAGKELFTGIRRLQNGGPACMGCHSISGIGALGGGALGPDLTLAATKFGDSGLASVLANLPFPTMNPIFGRRPLTPEEQANLRAFIGQASVTGRSTRAAAQLTGLAAGLALLMFAAAGLRWRRRLGGVRRPLIERARTQGAPGLRSNR